MKNLLLVMMILWSFQSNCQKTYGTSNAGTSSTPIILGGTTYTDDDRASIAKKEPSSTNDGIQSSSTVGHSKLFLENQSGSFSIGDEVLIINMDYQQNGSNHIFAYVESVGSNFIEVNRDLEDGNPEPFWQEMSAGI